MTKFEMFEKRFQEIMKSNSSDHIKSTRLATLMTDLERTYSIPALKNMEFDEENPQLMAFYSKVSAARTF